jgi:hypothetical protein
MTGEQEVAMAPTFTTITTELIEHADGRHVAYIDATSVVVFAYQQPDGGYAIEIHTRDDAACGRLRLLLDGESLPSDCECLAHPCWIMISSTGYKPRHRRAEVLCAERSWRLCEVLAEPD